MGIRISMWNFGLASQDRRCSTSAYQNSDQDQAMTSEI